MPTMANNLTGLIPTLFQSLDTVSREMIGIIPAVSRSSVADTVNIGQVLSVPVAKPRGTQDITPGNRPTGKGNDFDRVDVRIEKMKSADPIWWNGDEQGTQAQSGMLAVEKLSPSPY